MARSYVYVHPATEANRVKVAVDEIGSQDSAVVWPYYKMAYGQDGEVTPVSHENHLPVADPWLSHAIHVIESTYGDAVSIHAKDKDLLKFGQSDQVQTSLTTIMDLPSGTYNETYVSDNLITTVSSSSTSDTEEIVVEGHTISAGVFTFVSQTITLTGQTQATLTTPLARCTRIYNNGSTDLVGNVYAYQDDTSTAGVPDTAAGVHCIIPAGYNQSRKCSTTISNVDYWIITNVGASLLTKAAGFITMEVEIRFQGKVFRSQITLGGSNGTTDHEFKPYLIAPKNSDIRVRCSADQNNRSVSAHLDGVLAIVV